MVDFQNTTELNFSTWLVQMALFVTKNSLIHIDWEIQIYTNKFQYF